MIAVGGGKILTQVRMPAKRGEVSFDLAGVLRGLLSKARSYFFGTEMVMLRYWMTPW